MPLDRDEILREISALWDSAPEVDLTSFFREKGLDLSRQALSEDEREVVTAVIQADFEHRQAATGSQVSMTLDDYKQTFPWLLNNPSGTRLQDVDPQTSDQTPCIAPELDGVLAELRASTERGETVYPEVYFERYPQFRSELRRIFAGDIHPLSNTSDATSDDPIRGPAGQSQGVIEGFEKTYIDAKLQKRDPQSESGALIGGRYLLLDTIGQGGMGAVWLAEQRVPVKRKVAIKLIRTDLNTNEVIARFEAERQALAVMDHPHIAKIFDGGVAEDGRPYFVMEFVKGMTLTEYCDWAKMALNARLQLLILVCQAVHHAHQKGIIHRDLKPSNILVSLSDGRAVPKVIDFGLVKMLHKSKTKSGHQRESEGVVGTPLYMSPEQASSDLVDIDTRTDIYSLGVILYELLTGTTPLERHSLKKARFEEVQQLIREVEPPRPSLRLSGSDSLTSISAIRGVDAREYCQSLRNELDWIAMKALQKDRSQRYGTCQELARDLERYLADEVVEACPQTRGYRWRKFVRKHRFQVLSAAALLLTLVVGVAGTSWGYLRARASESRATVSERKAIHALGLAQRERDAKELQRQIAEQAEAEMLSSYLESTDDVISNLIGSKEDLGPQERNYLDKTLRRWQSFADRQGDDERTRRYRAQGLFQVGNLWRKLGRHTEARSQLAEAVSQQSTLVHDFPRNTEYRYELSRMHIGQGVLRHEMAEKEGALHEYRAAQQILRPLLQESPDVAAYDLELARATGNLGYLLDDLGNWEEAREEFQDSRDLLKSLVARHPDVPEYQSKLIKLIHGLADLLIQAGESSVGKSEYEAARQLGEKLIQQAPTVPDYQFDLAVSLYGLADLSREAGLRKQAQTLYEQSQSIQKQLTEQYPSVPQYQRGDARCHYALANLYALQGELERAKSEFEATLLLQQQLIQRFPSVPLYRDQLADTLFSQADLVRRFGDVESGWRVQTQAIDMFRLLARQHPEDREIQVKLAMGLVAQAAHQRQSDDPHAAIANLCLAEGMLRGLVEFYPGVVHYRLCLARCLLVQGHSLLQQPDQLGQASIEYVDSMNLLKELTRKYPDMWASHILLADVYFARSELLRRMNQKAESTDEYRSAQEILTTLIDSHSELRECRISLGGSKLYQAQASLDRGEVGDAIVWLTQGITQLGHESLRGVSDPQLGRSLRECYRWRAHAYSLQGRYKESLVDWEQAIAANHEKDRNSWRLQRAEVRRQSGGVIAAATETSELFSKSLSPLSGQPSEHAAPSAWTAEQLYHIARLLSVGSDESSDQQVQWADQSLVALRLSLEGGLSRTGLLDRLAAETDLDAVRDRPEFQKLVEEQEASTGGPAESKPESP